jgi:signal transduction histidine kinase
MASNAPSEKKYQRQKPLLFYAVAAIGFFILLIFGIRAFIAHEEMTGTIELAFALLTLAAVVAFEKIGSGAQSALTHSEEELIKRNDELRMLLSSISEVVFSIDVREDLRERDLKRELLQAVQRYSSEQKGIQRELERARGDIERAERRDAALSAGISVVKAVNHEINNITMGFTGCSMRLAGFAKDAADRLGPEEAGVVEKICATQDKLSGRLKDYAGFLTALFTKTDEPKKTIRLSDLVNKSVMDLVSELPCPGIAIEEKIPEDIDYECYPSQLRHAFYQLLKNSVEAMPEGGSLIVRAEKSGGSIIVTMEDTGKGIPEENIDMIFIPLFTQTKIYGGKGGSIAHRIIVANHGGTISVKSRTREMIESGKYPGMGTGTTVTISLPINKNL